MIFYPRRTRRSHPITALLFLSSITHHDPILLVEKGVGKERSRVAFHFLTPGVFDSTLVINPRGCHQWVSPPLSFSLSLHVISTPHPPPEGRWLLGNLLSYFLRYGAPIIPRFPPLFPLSFSWLSPFSECSSRCYPCLRTRFLAPPRTLASPIFLSMQTADAYRNAWELNHDATDPKNSFLEINWEFLLKRIL